MKASYLHPRDELVQTISRIYRNRMTTTSGGNLSILDENGDLWITPSGVDKGTLKPTDIMCVKKDGTIVGPHKPSSEYPFHRAIYKARPDIKAIVHAHPTSLVAFSIAKKIPNVKLYPASFACNGTVAFAPYGVPGSEDLGHKMAAAFAKGYDSVVLESHGVCCGGANLQEAALRVETLEFTCEAEIQAAQMGKPIALTDRQLALATEFDPQLPSMKHSVAKMTIGEKEARCQICRFVERGYAQRLFTGTTGTVSARVDADSFVITPRAYDRRQVSPEELVLVSKGKVESGKVPAAEVLAHQAVYAAQPEVNAVINACPPNTLAFSFIHQVVDTRTLPECYIFLREVSRFPFDTLYKKPETLAKKLSMRYPAAILDNNGVMVVGPDLLSAFDKLEVLDCSAGAIRGSLPLGGIVPMSDQVIEDIIVAFNLPK
ncbi:MAG: class II aldolase/adducin family protein [Kiritimatiellae bacterium]|nr:class II aldolase/adducin family protein [Kiritimatiellia bacterium]